MWITILHNPFMPVEFLDSKCMVSILNSSFMLLYKQYKVAFWADVLFATIVIIAQAPSQHERPNLKFCRGCQCLKLKFHFSSNMPVLFLDDECSYFRYERIEIILFCYKWWRIVEVLCRMSVSEAEIFAFSSEIPV